MTGETRLALRFPFPATTATSSSCLHPSSEAARPALPISSRTTTTALWWLSRSRFQSPIRYWDPAHHAAVVTLIESALDLAILGYFAALWLRRNSVGSLRTSSVSIIIPTLHETAALRKNLPRALAAADELGARVTIGPPGRGGQLRRGTEVAQGSIVLFLHADTVLPDNPLRWFS